jgi:hypothetical protein
MELSSAEEGKWDENAPKEHRPPSSQICLTQGIVRKIHEWLQENENLTHKTLGKALKETHINTSGWRWSHVFRDSSAVKDLLKIVLKLQNFVFCLLMI